MADEFIAVAGRVRNLLDKLRVILLAENLLGDLDDIAGMGIVEGKDERLGKIVHILIAWRIVEHFRIDSVSVGLQNQLYL